MNPTVEIAFIGIFYYAAMLILAVLALWIGVLLIKLLNLKIRETKVRLETTTARD